MGLSQSFGGAGGMGMRPEAAARALVQAEPLYYEAENDYAAINKALYNKAGGSVYDGLYDSATGEAPGGLYDSAANVGDVMYDTANDGAQNLVGSSRYDRVSAGGGMYDSATGSEGATMYDRAEPDITYNTAMPTRDSNGAGYARATSGTSLYDQLQEQQQSSKPAYSQATAPGAVQSGYAMASSEPMYDAAVPLSGSLASSYSLAAAGNVGGAATGSGYALAAAGNVGGAATGSGYAL